MRFSGQLARFAGVHSCPSPSLSLRRAFATAIQPYHQPQSICDQDETYFRYTSGRWLYNESQQMAQRYTRFDVGALHRVISSVCGASVVNMEKKEGVFNKSFIVSLSNGSQIAARIKNPIAGPKHLTTASEVATMDFVRNILGVPAPNVLAWSSNAENNGVGAEFILMETAPGVQLSTIWKDLDIRQKKKIVNSLISVEQKLLTVNFSKYGSLYYKRSMPETSRAAHLYADSSMEDASSSKFCIGPVANRSYHEDERATMNLDRGPWSSCEEYLCSLALREEAWIANYAKPHIHDDPFRNVAAGPQSQEDHLHVLRQYRSIVPALVPTSDHALSSILWHPDLNPGNVFVSEDDHSVVSIIDWQGCWAGPAYLQMTTPAFIEYTGTGDLPSGLDFPELPENYSEMSLRSQELVKKDHKAKMLDKLYEIKQLFPYRIDQRDTRVMPVRTAGRTWKDGLLPMQLALLNVAAKWPELSTPSVPCPLRFTRDEVDGLTEKRERYVECHQFLDDMRRSFGMRVYGWVSPNEYTSKRALLEEYEQKKVPQINSHLKAILPTDWWPFRDTVV